MRNCLILGTGRSGTSMVAGCLARSGYHQGAHLHLPRAANPKGFFEDQEINAINESVLAYMLTGTAAEQRFGEGQRWLAIPPQSDQPLCADEALAKRLRQAVAKQPFAYKDPRFCFTYEVWQPFLPETRQVVVFRDPRLTAASMAEECRQAPYLKGLELEQQHFLALWQAAYRRILSRSAGGDWLFVHYNQVLDGSALPGLESFLEASLDHSFPDPKLLRAEPKEPLPASLAGLYTELCGRAGYRPQAVAPRQRRQISAAARVHNAEDARRVVAQAQRCRGVELELFLLVPKGLELDSELQAMARCLSVDPHSEGRAWQAAARAASQAYVALLDPQADSLPGRLVAALEALEKQPTDYLSCDYYLSDKDGQFVGRSNPGLMGAAPGPRFEAGLVVSTAALLRLPSADFFPALRAGYDSARRAGRIQHLAEPLVVVPKAIYRAEYQRTRIDGQLIELHAAPGPRPAAPRISVSLCTWNRVAVLSECLQALCRQTLPVGGFELVLVDDGSTDGTAEFLASLELPIPWRCLSQPNGGLAAARNLGLAHMRGEYVLFINDDTIAAPDLLERHLAAHQAAGRPTAILGRFEQPPSELGNALMRVLEQGSLMFDFAQLKSGHDYDGLHFYTCNVSAPLAAIRTVGGFDTSFRQYGCEDSDLGLRLEAAGLTVRYQARARAWHRHRFDLNYIERRAQTVAHASVQLMRKHPVVLERWGNGDLSREYLHRHLAETAVERARLRAGVAELCRLDLSALEGFSEAAKGLAQRSEQRLHEHLTRLHGLWFEAGTLAGMECHGLQNLGELRLAKEPKGSTAPTGPRLAAAPDWSHSAELEALLAANDGLPVALKLRLLAGSQWKPADLERRLKAAYDAVNAKRDPAMGPLECDVELAALPGDQAGWLALESEVQAWWGALPQGLEPVGNAPATGLTLRLERLVTAADLRAFAQRFSGGTSAPLQAQRASGFPYVAAVVPARRSELPAPELSVIVPSANRPAQLQQLLAALDRQTLEAQRFEVLIVDDGSDTPLEASLAAQAHPYRLRHWRTQRQGPAAARNLALEAAHGKYVLFLNDDAVPGDTLLQEHLSLQRTSLAPMALLGAFSLLPKHRDHSLADYLETSLSLFAQPRMQPGVHYHGLSLCTGNLSLPKAALLDVGGFDAQFPEPGGEDSELGLRLEQSLGVRVRFEPQLACAHDHDLDIDGLYRRKQTLGRSTWRIQTLHGDLGLTGELGWPLSPQVLSELRSSLLAAQPAIDAALAQARQLKAAERQSGRRQGQGAKLRALFERIETHGFRLGLLAAAQGQQLPDALGNAALPVAATQVSLEGQPRALPRSTPARLAAVNATLPGAHPKDGATAGHRRPAPQNRLATQNPDSQRRLDNPPGLQLSVG